MSDESEIRELQQLWFRATMNGDVDAICELMTDDVLFLTPGQPPFGRQEFIESFRAMKEKVTMDCRGEYEEIIVDGNVACARAKLSIIVTPRNGSAPKRLSGHTLSIFRRSSDQKWRLHRDANLLAVAAD